VSWPLVKLDKACSLLTDGTHYTPADVGNGFPFLTVKDVSTEGLDFNNCSRINKEEYDKADSGNSAPKIGDVLFSKDGTVGKVHVVKESEHFAVLSSLAILRPKENLDSGYLGYVLKSPITLRQATKNKTGSALRRIILSDIKNLEIPLPPLNEQKRIAAILHKADSLRRKRQKAIQLADQFLRSVFLDLFGDPVTNPKGWEVTCLNNISSTKGEYGSGKPAITFSKGDVRYIRITDIDENSQLKDEKVSLDDAENESKKYLLSDGDLLFARSGATVGKTYLFKESDGQAVFAGYLIRFRVDKEKALPEFVKGIVDSKAYWDWVLSYQRVVAQPNINAKQYGNEFKFVLPPLEEQMKFVRIRAKVFKIINKYGQTKNESLFESLSQKAFVGEL